MSTIYLSDNELKERLHSEDGKTRLSISPSGGGEFREADQISICSIDLKLSSLIWLEKRSIFSSKRSMIDLGDTFYDKQIHSKYWTEKTLPKDGYILKPNQHILARIDEEIEIPLDCLGKIEARSGMNRLLMIVTLGDFVNPGYKGRYPLQIINMSKHKIRIYPGMSVCQLLLSKLSSPPSKLFSESSSSYHCDDGGPARWWEDRQIKLFRKDAVILERQDIDEILDLCSNYGLNDYRSLILMRFRKFYKKREKNSDNLERSVEEFLKQEKKLKSRNELHIKYLNAAMKVMLPAGSIFSIIKVIIDLLAGQRLIKVALFAGLMAFFLLLIPIVLYAIHILEKKQFIIANK